MKRRRRRRKKKKKTHRKIPKCSCETESPEKQNQERVWIISIGNQIEKHRKSTLFLDKEREKEKSGGLWCDSGGDGDGDGENNLCLPYHFRA